MKIISTDTGLVNIEARRVYRALLDLKKYKLWWPKVIVFKVLPDHENYSAVWIRPFGGPGFEYRIKSLVENKNIEIEYSAGIYNGTGTWNIKENKTGVLLSYSVNLEIKNIFVKAASKVLNAKKLHSLIINKVFIGLEKYLKKNNL